MRHDTSEEPDGASSIGEEFVPLRSPLVQSVEIDGQTVLYVESVNKMHVLNPSATVVWNCMDGTGTIAEIAGDISAAFAVDLDTVRRDVLQAVREFASDGLLVGFDAVSDEDAHPRSGEAPEDRGTPDEQPHVLGPPPNT